MLTVAASPIVVVVWRISTLLIIIATNGVVVVVFNTVSAREVSKALVGSIGLKVR